MWTGDGRVFFYNPSTRTSVWERPEDLLGRPDVDKAINTTPEQLLGTNKDESKPSAEVVVELSKKRPESESSGDESEVSNKKLKMDPVGAGNGNKISQTCKSRWSFSYVSAQFNRPISHQRRNRILVKKLPSRLKYELPEKEH